MRFSFQTRNLSSPKNSKSTISVMNVSMFPCSPHHHTPGQQTGVAARAITHKWCRY
ncbi:hypothetical protein I79_010722 [Cricetulus griseus]|uniref:Uncharacterized protein n=1 Tax=Cricetulus griseus TaxID=10029 RepID=G3HJ84_CRIGR|nr:hypothetical protein I79_010722 [Cricetulus griseus]